MVDGVLARLRMDCLNESDKEMIENMLLNEQLRIEGLLDGKDWVSRDRTRIKVSDMNFAYIENVIRYILRTHELETVEDTVLFKELLTQYAIKKLRIKGEK